jgi:AraC-like DNA-binding protein
VSLPSTYLVHLVELTRRFGVDDDELLEELGLEVDDLTEATRRLEVPEVIRLVERARALTGEPGLGVYLGLAMRASWHGYLGFAVLTAKDIGDALKLAERFIATRTTALAFKLTVEGGVASVVLEEKADFGSARDVVVLALLIGLSTIGQALSGRELEGKIEVALPRPPWLERYAENARLDRVSFDAPVHRIVFDAKQLSTPFQLADASARKLAAAECEKELAALGFAGRLAVRVRELALRDGVVVDVEGVAKQLSMSSRTLKRRLAVEGTSYSELLEAERKAKAEHLLAHTKLSVKEIAAALGYADTAAFSHAFMRWTGKSPSDLR